MRSIIFQEPRQCYLCGTHNATDRHHVFPGANRRMSEKYGLTVNLCRDCHRKIHDNLDGMRKLQEHVQILAMVYYDWSMSEWIERFNKNYLENDEEH